MAEPGLIEAYLAALRGELRAPARLRRRIEAEVAEHLRDAVAELAAGGRPAAEAEREALASFDVRSHPWLSDVLEGALAAQGGAESWRLGSARATTFDLAACAGVVQSGDPSPGPSP